MESTVSSGERFALKNCSFIENQEEAALGFRRVPTARWYLDAVCLAISAWSWDSGVCGGEAAKGRHGESATRRMGEYARTVAPFRRFTLSPYRCSADSSRQELPFQHGHGASLQNGPVALNR